jgi:outer membrane protein assembly factor BamA
VLGGLLLTLALLEAAPRQPPPEVIAQIQVHGNFITPDDEVIKLAEVQIGMPFDGSTIERVAVRLHGSGRFVHVEVLKRFASISDLTQVLLVIIVDDGRVNVDWDTGEVKPAGGLTGRRGPKLMFLPILGSEDGYGLTYGVRFALPNPTGQRSRLGFPLSWGGEKTAGVELEKNLDRGPFTRVQGGAALTRRENPFYEKDDDRRRIWLQGERRFSRPLRAGVTAGWQRASFDGADDTFATIGADATIDTRLDPFLTPNAIFARAAWERLGLQRGAVHRTSLETIGHLGLFGQNLLVLKARRDDSSADLPPYLESLLGGMANLRGFHAGTAAGETLVAGTAELRVPLTSPLDVGKLGVSAFVDAGAVHRDGERLRSQRFRRGVGGSAWITATVFKIEFSIARGLGSGTRVHFGAAATF